jgi:hypothetical protein
MHTVADLRFCVNILHSEIANESKNPRDVHWGVKSARGKKAFEVFDTTKHTISVFAEKVTRDLDAIRERLTLGDIADSVLGNDFINRNPYNSYDVPLLSPPDVSGLALSSSPAAGEEV